jgi:PAS domain S-box-containing protein
VRAGMGRRAAAMPLLTQLDTPSALRRIAVVGRCLLWTAEIFDRGSRALEWRLSMWDEEAARRLLPVEQQPGQPYDEAWFLARLPEDRAESDRRGDAEVRAGRSYQQEFRVRRADGEIRWLLEDVQVEMVGPGRWEAVGVCTDVTERHTATERGERLLSGLRTVLAIADRLILCPDLDTLLRTGVQAGRDRLGLERCSIFLAEGDAVRGTYGTDPQGALVDERALRLPLSGAWRHYFRSRAPDDPRFDLLDAIRSYWNGSEQVSLGPGWVACTPLLVAGSRPVGVMFNDSAVTGSPIDPDQQEVVALYCSLLGNLISRRQLADRQEKLLEGLRTVLSIADELLSCPDLDTVLRRAVELARERLGLERCAIFLTEGEMARGTYGTDEHGGTTDERGLTIPAGCVNPDFRPRAATDPRWEVGESDYRGWDGEHKTRLGRGWVVTTPLLPSHGRPIGVLFNDAALSGAPLDPDQQDLVALYCALLGNLIARRQASEALDLLREHGTSHVWRAVVSANPNRPGEYHWRIGPLDEAAAQRILPLEVLPGEEYADAANRARLPEDRERMNRDYITALRSGSPSYSHEFRAIDRHGALRTFYEHVSVRPLGPGKWRMVGLVTNITEVRRAQEAVREIAARAPCLIWEADIREVGPGPDDYSWDLRLHSEEASQRFLPLDRLAGESYLDAWYRCRREDEWSDVHETSRRALRAGLPEYAHGFRCRRADGEERWLHEQVYLEPQGPGRWRAVGVCTDVTELKQTAAALRDREEQLQLSIQATRQILWTWEPGRGTTRTADAVERVLGYPAAQVDNSLEWWLDRLHPDDRERARESLRAITEGGVSTWSAEYRFRRHDGSFAWVIDHALVLRDAGGTPLRVLGSMVDVSEHRRLQEQLLQAQKMEAVGRLAGGIAHDFNNMLAVINGYAELLLERHRAGDPASHALQEIAAAGDRAAQLTRRLLLFSRKELYTPRLLDLDATIRGLERMLRRLIGEDIELSIRSDPHLGWVHADPGHIEQVLLNLAVNARDAMPLGGRLTVGMESRHLEVPYSCRTGILNPGDYILLSVSDTGSGIDSEILPHIFEPFFTTKEVGQGTGLGLAMVYSILQQIGGGLDVESRRGEGTLFRLYLPRAAAPERAEAPGEPARPERSPGSGTVLLVEDDEQVRGLVTEVLSGAGYTVLAAADGEAALRLCQESDDRIDLLLTDVVMPGLGGREVSDRLTALYPHLKTLYMSGYTDDAIVRRGVESTGLDFIQKPFAPGDLAARVRQVLDSS